MKTLKEIQDTYAKEHRFLNWRDMHYTYKGWGRDNWSIEIHINEIAKRYALEAVKADREVASEITRIWQDEKNPNWGTLREAILNRPIELK